MTHVLPVDKKKTIDSNSSNFQGDIKFYRIDIGAHLTVVRPAIFKYRIFLFLSFTFIIKVSSPPYPTLTQQEIHSTVSIFQRPKCWQFPGDLSHFTFDCDPRRSPEERWWTHADTGAQGRGLANQKSGILGNGQSEDRRHDYHNSLISRQYPQRLSSPLWRMTKYLVRQTSLSCQALSPNPQSQNPLGPIPSKF